MNYAGNMSRGTTSDLDLGAFLAGGLGTFIGMMTAGVIAWQSDATPDGIFGYGALGGYVGASMMIGLVKGLRDAATPIKLDGICNAICCPTIGLPFFLTHNGVLAARGASADRGALLPQ